MSFRFDPDLSLDTKPKQKHFFQEVQKRQNRGKSSVLSMTADWIRLSFEHWESILDEKTHLGAKRLNIWIVKYVTITNAGKVTIGFSDDQEAQGPSDISIDFEDFSLIFKTFLICFTVVWSAGWDALNDLDADQKDIIGDVHGKKCEADQDIFERVDDP